MIFSKIYRNNDCHRFLIRLKISIFEATNKKKTIKLFMYISKYIKTLFYEVILSRNVYEYRKFSLDINI